MSQIFDRRSSDTLSNRPGTPTNAAPKNPWSFGWPQVRTLVIGIILASIFTIWENMIFSHGYPYTILFQVGSFAIPNYTLPGFGAVVILYLSATIGGPWVGGILSLVQSALILFFMANNPSSPSNWMLVVLADTISLGTIFLLGLIFAFAQRRYGLAFVLSTATIVVSTSLIIPLAYLSLLHETSHLSLIGQVIISNFLYNLIVSFLSLLLAFPGKIISDRLSQARNTRRELSD